MGIIIQIPCRTKRLGSDSPVAERGEDRSEKRKPESAILKVQF